MTMDTIYINGRFLTQDITGVQRYAVEMLSALDRIFDTLPDRRVKLVCLTPDVELNIQISRSKNAGLFPATCGSK